MNLLYRKSLRHYLGKGNQDPYLDCGGLPKYVIGRSVLRMDIWIYPEASCSYIREEKAIHISHYSCRDVNTDLPKKDISLVYIRLFGIEYIQLIEIIIHTYKTHENSVGM